MVRSLIEESSAIILRLGDVLELSEAKVGGEPPRRPRRFSLIQAIVQARNPSCGVYHFTQMTADRGRRTAVEKVFRGLGPKVIPCDGPLTAVLPKRSRRSQLEF